MYNLHIHSKIININLNSIIDLWWKTDKICEGLKVMWDFEYETVFGIIVVLARSRQFSLGQSERNKS